MTSFGSSFPFPVENNARATVESPVCSRILQEVLWDETPNNKKEHAANIEQAFYENAYNWLCLPLIDGRTLTRNVDYVIIMLPARLCCEWVAAKWCTCSYCLCVSEWLSGLCYGVSIAKGGRDYWQKNKRSTQIVGLRWNVKCSPTGNPPTTS